VTARGTSRHPIAGLLTGAAGIAAATLLIWALSNVAPASSLGALYVVAVLPVAIGWGYWLSLVTAIVSGFVFDFFFFPPLFTFTHERPQDVVVSVISALTALVVSVLATRMRERASEAERLAREQVGLRRVATAVAAAAPPDQVFGSVAEEVGTLLGCDFSVVNRYEPDQHVIVVACWTADGGPPPVPLGTRLALGGRTVSGRVLETAQSARVDRYGPGAGEGFRDVVESGVRSAVGAPISVEGGLWGVMLAASRGDPLPVDTQGRLAAFTELLATAIANAEAQEQLTASRARIIETADTTRRTIERNLHDGAQQRLVSSMLKLQAARAEVPAGAEDLAEQLDEVSTELTDAVDELHEIARGLHPAVLEEGGLRPALTALARRSVVPVQLDVRPEGRLPQRVEVTTYYLVAEAMTNAVKHSAATVLDVSVTLDGDRDGLLTVQVRDDGRGGASVTRGSGLVGLKDRVEAVGGQFGLVSTPGKGTVVTAKLPVTN
jgi:signal transduction histidine kinase